jgi:hypothetical protein
MPAQSVFFSGCSKRKTIDAAIRVFNQAAIEHAVKSELDRRSDMLGQYVTSSSQLALSIYEGIREPGGGQTYSSFIALVFDLGIPIDLMIQTLHMNYDKEKNYFGLFMMAMRFIAPFAVETGLVYFYLIISIICCYLFIYLFILILLDYRTE